MIAMFKLFGNPNFSLSTWINKFIWGLLGLRNESKEYETFKSIVFTF